MESKFSLPRLTSLLLEDFQSSDLSQAVANQLDRLSFVLGTPGEDSLTGTDNRDFIFGLGGNDSIEGLGGNDFLFGGDGDNTIRGGDGNDLIYSGTGGDLLFGDAGDDYFNDTSGGNEIDGGEGRDTVDYRNVDESITLQYEVGSGFSGLQVVRENLDPDVISNVEKVIGPEGKANSINFQDVSFGGPFSGPIRPAPAIDVNLSENRLSYADSFFGIPETTVTVENFVDVVGSPQDDIIIGNEAANNLEGRLGEDILIGGGGDDTLSTFEQDTLIGSSGSDTFALKASGKSISSNIGRPFPGGSRPLEASEIVDFQLGVDKIQLSIDASIVSNGPVSFRYSGFGALSLGELDSDSFLFLGSGPEVPDSPYIAYDRSNGDLFYNRSASESTKIAVLQGAPSIDAGDIFVV